MKKKIIIILIGILLLAISTIFGVTMKKNQKTIDNNEIKYENNEFNLNLIKTVNNNNLENYLISPYSIEIALSMLKEGAKGNTLTEIENVIGKRNINNVSVKNRIGVANAAFVKNDYKKYIMEDYYSVLQNKYNSEILYDDFKNPKVINDWVNEKTNGMIKEILNNIDKDFTLGIANALAIDVEWNVPFDCNDTRSQKFTKVDNSKLNVEMMHKTLKYDGYKYLSNDNATGVVIPYKKYDKNTGKENYDIGSNLEFIAILPKDNVNKYINNLNNEELNNLFNSARESSSDFEIDLALPRFSYDYKLDNFMNILKMLGIKDAFDSEQADFTNIIPTNDVTGNLYVGEAIHKTHIDLNEKGTKAAAVTYFGMYTSGMVMEKESVDIIFDKPFIYIIRDAETKEMLFFGTVYEPNKWSGSTCSNENQ